MKITAHTLQRLCLAHGWTVALAESCTGGLLAHRLTNLSGASGYFLGATIAYHNRAKTALLDIASSTLARSGAVSAVVARLMATRVRSLFGATCGMAITGIAGPAGGSRSKPVGTVYIAVAGRGPVSVRRHAFRGSRAHIKRQAADQALIQIYRQLAQ